jgi:hypothetical protein
LLLLWSRDPTFVSLANSDRALLIPCKNRGAFRKYVCDQSMTMHQWTAKHWIAAALVAILAVAAFSLMWS